MEHTYYWTCPTCGANLDPQESCEDCNPKDKITYGSSRKPNNYQAVTQPIVNKLNPKEDDLTCHTNKH